MTTSPASLTDVQRTARLLTAYETGQLDEDETVALFADLIRSGSIDHLQGHYQRTAWQMIRCGLIDSAPATRPADRLGPATRPRRSGPGHPRLISGTITGRGGR